VRRVTTKGQDGEKTDFLNLEGEYTPRRGESGWLKKKKKKKTNPPTNLQRKGGEWWSGVTDGEKSARLRDQGDTKLKKKVDE